MTHRPLFVLLTFYGLLWLNVLIAGPANCSMMSACHSIPYRVPSTHPLYLAVMCLSLFYGTVSFNYPRKQIETTTHFKHLLLNCLFYLDNNKNCPQSSQMPITMHNRSLKKWKQKINNKCSRLIINTWWRWRYCCTKKNIVHTFAISGGVGDFSPFFSFFAARELLTDWIKGLFVLF